MQLENLADAPGHPVKTKLQGLYNRIEDLSGLFNNASKNGYNWKPDQKLYEKESMFSRCFAPLLRNKERERVETSAGPEGEKKLVSRPMLPLIHGSRGGYLLNIGAPGWDFFEIQ